MGGQEDQNQRDLRQTNPSGDMEKIPKKARSREKEDEKKIDTNTRGVWTAWHNKDELTNDEENRFILVRRLHKRQKHNDKTYKNKKSYSTSGKNFTIICEILGK